MNTDRPIKTLVRQTISSTHLDSQGERTSLERLKDFASIGRMPLGFAHDAERGESGYLDNFEVIDDPNCGGQYLLVADLHYYDEDEVKKALRGFSYSTTEITHRTNGDCDEFIIFLPYPYYNNVDDIEYFFKDGDGNSVGKWVKKSADAETARSIAMIVSAASAVGTLVGGLILKEAFKDYVWPSLKKIIDLAIKKYKREMDYDVVVLLEHEKNKQKTKLVLTTRNGQIETLSQSLVENAIITALAWLNADAHAAARGCDRIIMKFKDGEYVVNKAQYNDGTSSVFNNN